jgi:acyl-CoA synthetase (AMP-forming)/AMP-acid ligase II
MFKSGGYNVYPREVELAIEQHPDIAACAVVPIPDARFQEVGIAFVQCLTGRSVPAQELREWCSARLANYKVPKQFRVIAQLPMLGIGKIDRQALRALAEARLEEATVPAGGSGPVRLRSRANAEVEMVERPR